MEESGTEVLVVPGSKMLMEYGSTKFVSEMCQLNFVVLRRDMFLVFFFAS